MQVLEYDRSFLSARILLDQFNGNLIISGAFGMFRKDMVVAVGGYDPDTVGEDMELVTKLHVFCKTNGIDYLIKYAPNAVCWSQAPETLRDLIKQRKRWHRGLFECMTKHWIIFGKLRYGLVGSLSYTYFLIYELFSPAIELFGIFTMVLAAMFNFVNIPYMLMFFGIYAVYGSIMSLTAFFSRVQTRDLSLSRRDVVRALVLSLFEIVVLRFIMAVTRMVALIGVRKNKNRWDKLERTELHSQ
jgi:biofilm PGA synthesis N-glycosyltransferase PgaC